MDTYNFYIIDIYNSIIRTRDKCKKNEINTLIGESLTMF